MNLFYAHDDDDLVSKRKVAIPKFVAEWYEDQVAKSSRLSGADIFRIIQEVLNISNGEGGFDYYGVDEHISHYALSNEEAFLHLLVNCSYEHGYENGYEIDNSFEVREGDWVISREKGSCDVRHVEACEVDDDDDDAGILLVNGVQDEFYCKRELDEFYKKYRLFVKKENLEDEK